MLAKLWKKVLLAVCIIACLFNITSKLVNRHSLKENLETANDGVLVYDIFQKNEDTKQEAVEGEENEQVEQSNEVIDNNKTENNEVVENTVEKDEENEGSVNYKDFTVIF